MLALQQHTGVPIAYTDHWRIFIRRGDWTNEKIRIAMWRCALTGEAALYPDYNQGTPVVSLVSEGARYIGVASRFFRENLRHDPAGLQPHDELLDAPEGTILTAIPGKEYVVYDERGDVVEIDLAAVTGKMRVIWVNPRNGEKKKAGKVKGGGKQTFTPPGRGEDWVLHLYEL